MSLALRMCLLFAWMLLVGCDGCGGKPTYDNDGDGYNVSVDCDDDEPSVNPGEAEDCSELGDGWDNDCDGYTDDEDPDPAGATTVYEDADGDGYGDDASARLACGEVEGFVAVGGDCDDGNARTWPGAIEICDGQDNDCDVAKDDQAEDKPGWWPDADGDGYGDASADMVSACDEDSQGLVNDDTDCNDRDPAINPSADEICDGGVDNDCDPATDEKLDTALAWLDADADGWPDPDADPVTPSCEDTGPPAGYTSRAPEPLSDCDDDDANTYPGAEEQCGDGIDHNCDGLVGTEDGDGDGSPGCGPTGAADCDDGDPAINPDVTEICDEIDNNCDGQINEAGASGELSWYLDEDGDTWGDAASSVTACENPGGRSLSDEDCDDTDATVNPAATETCDGVDQDCDGALATDEMDLDGDGWMRCEDDCDDNDADFYPDAAEDDCADPNDYNCDGSVGYVDADGDGHAACRECDDSDALIHPDADERCDLVDNDCDGDTDEADAIDRSDWYPDADGDGYGDSSATATSACDAPAGYVSDNSDCDDNDASISPDTAWYIDGDGDGYGTTAGTTTSCTQPSGYAATDDDCDDTDPAIHPDATEDDCTDATDYNCDGSVAYADADADTFAACEDCDDSDATLNPDTIWYGDDDGDGYGESASTEASCTQPTGYVDNDGDCDDLNAEINPDAVEVCDGDDNDCDELTDPDTSADAATWYIDADGDGYGAPTATTTACDEPDGYADNDQDCDDADDTIMPSATETCDGEDDNCDGVIDEDEASDAATWYTDADADGYGDVSARVRACEQPSGTVADKTDCDDTDAAVSPSEPERCNGVDDDCDDSVDEDDAIDPTTWYADADADGFGDPTDSVESCDAPASHVSDDSDCDDSDASVNPDATEGTGDEVDQDCDGAETCYADLDQDGYADQTGATTGSTDIDCDDARELDQYAPGGDCDDGDAAYHPSADESACTLDFNCDGHVGTTDADGDGYVSCQDCDDANGAIKPGATEVCDDQDNDCNGLVDDDDAVDAGTTSTWYADADGDGYGDAAAGVESCDPPDGYGADDTDCDDTDGDMHPDAPEGVADERDQDCDGRELCYADADSDGYASDDGATVSSADLGCDGSGEADDTAPQSDCDDEEEAINPDAIDDTCDTIDWDCNGHDGDLAVDDDGATYAGALTTVQDALDALTGGELVCVAPGTYREILFVADVEFELVALSCDEGTPLDTDDCRTDTVLSGDLDGDGTGDGGVLELRDNAASGTLTSTSRIEGFTITGGARDLGAGIYLAYAAPRLRQLRVTGNTADASASGVYGWGGGIAAMSADLDLADSEISDNIADGGIASYPRGGGMYFSGSDLYTLTLDGVRFTGNSATSESGASAAGGGLYAQGATRVTVSETDLSENLVSGGNSTFGGGAYLNGIGGGTWTSGTVSGNTSSLYGGGLALTETEDLVLSDVTFSDNTAETQGGGLWLQDGPALMSNLEFTGNDSAGTGGAVGIWAGEVGAVDSHTFSECTFSDNTAAEGGAGLYLTTYPTSAIIEAELTITGSTFSGNAASGDVDDGYGGGAVSGTLYTGTHTLDLSIESSTFTGNSVEDSDPTDGSNSVRGGALWFKGDALTIDSSTFSANSSTWHGGALWIHSATEGVVVTDSAFDSNVAMYSGSALESYATLDISGSTFSNNVSQDTAGRGDFGGAVKLNTRGETSNLTVTDSTFSDNTSAGVGALFWESAGDVEVSNTTFTGNSAGLKGGAIWGTTSNTVVLKDLEVSENLTVGTSATGANVYLGSADSVSISDSIFEANQGTVDAALHVSNVELVELTRLDLYENSATSGGTIGLTGDSGGAQTVTMSHLSFIGNTGSQGALRLNDSGSDGTIDATLTNAIFLANTASGEGGAIQVADGSSLTVTNAVFLDNQAVEGGAIQVSGVSPSLTVLNSAFSGNTCTGSSTCGEDVGVEAGTASITYSHAAEHVTGATSRFTGSYSTSDFEAGTGNLWDSDPQFTDTSSTDPADWDLTLSTTSPLLEVGDPSILNADGTTSDIGAYGGPGGESW